MPSKIVTARLIRGAKVSGLAAAIAASGVVLWRLVYAGGNTLLPLIQVETLLAVAGLSVVYGASLFLLALSWARLAVPVRSGMVPALVRAYGMSSIAKYLPGNILHFAGRHLAAAGAGVSHKVLLAATLIEGLLCVVAALAASACFLLLASGTKLELPVQWHAWVVSLGAAGVFGTALMVAGGRKLALRRGLGDVYLPESRAVLVGAQLAFAFFVVNGLIAASLGHWVVGTTASPAAIAGAALVAWVVGFLTPGVSGGIGVREAVLLVTLKPLIGEVNALSLALLLRVVTTLGDVLFLGATYVFVRKPLIAAGNQVNETEQ